MSDNRIKSDVVASGDFNKPDSGMTRETLGVPSLRLGIEHGECLDPTNCHYGSVPRPPK